MNAKLPTSEKVLPLHTAYSAQDNTMQNSLTVLVPCTSMFEYFTTGHTHHA